MGVQGLWQVLEPVGKPVDINRLRGKVFAIGRLPGGQAEYNIILLDVSIWLHQAVKGYRDKDGNPLPNAHLLGVFFRVCKLLNYGVKPVFVFDGGVPVLKRQTMSLRKTRKIEAMDKSETSRKKLLTSFLQQEIQRQTRQALPPTLRMESALAKLSSPSKDKSRSPRKASTSHNDRDTAEDLEIFRENWADAITDDGEKFNRSMSDKSEESDSSYEEQYSRDYSENFSSIMSENFDALPLETQHEILFEMQESKKNNSWGKIHQMPQDLQSFSSFQMDRLVKRRTLQKKIQKVQHEMGQRHIHVQNLDDLLKLDYDFDENKSEVIASQEGGFVLVKTKSEANGVQKKENSNEKSKSSESECTTITDGCDTSTLGGKDIQGTTESERLLLAIDMLQNKTSENNPGGFSSDAVRAILSKIQTRLKATEEKLKTPAEVITIDSDDDSDNINNDNESTKIKRLVSSLNVALPVFSEEGKLSGENPGSFKISWTTQGGIPKVSFGSQPKKKIGSSGEGDKPELVMFEDSDECKALFDSKKNIPLIDLDEDQQLDLAIKMSEDNDFCKIIYDNTPKKETSEVEILKKPSSESPKALSIIQDFSQQKISSQCAKFLDSVGFSEKVPLKTLSMENTNLETENDCKSSCSEDDFEEVHIEEKTLTISRPESENSTFLSSSSTALKESINGNEESKISDKPVLTINLNKDSLSIPPENDIFSDIFESKIGSNGSSENELKEIIHNNEVGTKSNEKVLTINFNKESLNVPPENDIFSDIFENKIDCKTSENGTRDIFYDPLSKSTEMESNVEHSEQIDTMEDDSCEMQLKSDSESDSSLVEVNSNEAMLLNEEPTLKVPEQEKVIEPTTSKYSSNQKIARTLGTMPNNPSVKMITAEYLQAQQKLNTEQSKLQQSKGFQERIATSITDQMYIEAQELLALFGIPYVISPMEAESQCAFLDTACLTDGTLTDDSDIWLFGGRRVYKNFFSQGEKHVEFYQYADIVRVLSLDREKLVLAAMLTGSDYTEGIEGVGPVTALEIISEFPPNDASPMESLIKFRDWWSDSQQSKVAMEVGNKVREKFLKLKLRPGFPNKAVYDAYLDPTIDNSTESFKWGNPDLDALRTYTKMKFGWDQTKCDSTLLPVVKNLNCQANEIQRQLTMDKFIIFGGKEGTTKRKLKSQRLARAVKKIKRAAPSSGELKLSSSDSDGSEDDKPAKRSPEKKAITLPKKIISKRTSASGTLELESEVSSSPVQSNVNDNKTHNVSAVKKVQVIPQKVQDETNKQMNKIKAIELFKSKKKSDG